MVTLKTPQQIHLLRQSGSVVAELLVLLKNTAKAGMTTQELDRMAEAFVVECGAFPAFKGYQDYPCSLCTSVNEEVIHGIPSGRRLKEGDVLSIDAGVVKDGFFSDAAITVPIGSIDSDKQKLLKVTEESLYKGIEQARAGNHVSDISHAIQVHVEANGFSVVRDFVGHGIGQRLHEEPQVPNFGPPGQGLLLKVGMVLAIEPMVNQGSWEIFIRENKWTAVTKDSKLSAHFEHSIVILEDQAEVLTVVQ